MYGLESAEVSWLYLFRGDVISAARHTAQSDGYLPKGCARTSVPLPGPQGVHHLQYSLIPKPHTQRSRGGSRETHEFILSNPSSYMPLLQVVAGVVHTAEA